MKAIGAASRVRVSFTESFRRWKSETSMRFFLKISPWQTTSAQEFSRLTRL